MERFEQLGQDLQSAYERLVDRRRRRRRVARAAAIVSAVALVLSAAAIGAAQLLGWPAPAQVKREIAAVDQGLPADLRLNPDVEHARAVAATDSAVMYAASLRDGGSCTEIVTAGARGRGTTCTTSLQIASHSLDLVAPSDEGAGPNSPIVIGGRVNGLAGSRLEVVYFDASSDAVTLGDDRYFLFEVPAEHRASVHSSGIEFVARDADGSIVARAAIPSDWDDPAVPDDREPLYVSTRSDASDLTKVYGLEGHVNAGGAESLRLDYGDGAYADIPLRADGSYEYNLPAERVDDFMQPRTLVALDAQGDVVSSAQVAAVAYWRGHERRVP